MCNSSSTASIMGPPIALTGGMAAIPITGLSAGGHSIAAFYSSDSDNFSDSDDSASPVQQMVSPATPL